MRVGTAAELSAGRLLELFNAGFSDYLIPLQLDTAALRTHLRENDIALARSPVAVDGEPVAFALVGVRGPDAWIGGMATVPAHRRTGLARRVLDAAVESAAAAGCRTLWLEVVDRNAAAVALYRARGFAQVRDLAVWSLPAAAAGGAPGTRVADEREAHAWIAAHREEREPWQRADGTLDRLRGSGAALRGVVLERSGGVAGALVCRDATTVSVLQMAAADDEASEALLDGAADGRALQVTNAPAQGRVSRALERRGASVIARQHEMRLDLPSEAARPGSRSRPP